MPELPEVETMVRGVRPFIEGRAICEMEFCPCSRRPLTVTPTAESFSSRVRNAAIRRVYRIAKRIVIDLDVSKKSQTDGGKTASIRTETLHIIIEPRMTGLLLVSNPPTAEHRRICWHLKNPDSRRMQNGSAKVSNATQTSDVKRFEFWDRRGLGTVRLLDTDELKLLQDSLGVDAIEIQQEQWPSVFGRTSRPIKVALLDQTKVAGIGNLYASEILHLACVHPAKPVSRLRGKDWNRIHNAAQQILRDAIKYEGSTLGDGTYRNALNKDGSYQNLHRVYKKTGERCPTCENGIVERIVQCQRSTFFCSSCQR